jgi:MFS family permease
MLLLQIPLAALSGWLVDRGHDRMVMVLGLMGLSLAMACWTLAGWYGPGWLWAAYFIWGGFGLVNVAQPSLALKLSPREDNALQLSLYRPIGGLLAAIAGLIGGGVLNQCATGQQLAPLIVFQSLFIFSGLGRSLAALWFLPDRNTSTS